MAGGTINNLKNITMLPRFSAICGITEQEVKDVFREDVARIAGNYDCTPEEMFQKIKLRYDGYHFASRSADVYNPFSLLNAFCDDELQNCRFSTGTPTFLIRQLQHFKTDIHLARPLRGALVSLRPAHGEHEECLAAALPERLPHYQGLRPRLGVIHAGDT